jgi:hypothetical protein
MLKQIEKMTLWLCVYYGEQQKELKEELKKIADENGIIFHVMSLGGPTQLQVFRKNHDYLFFDTESRIRTFIDFLKTEQKEKESLLIKIVKGDE